MITYNVFSDGSIQVLKGVKKERALRLAKKISEKNSITSSLYAQKAYIWYKRVSSER